MSTASRKGTEEFQKSLKTTRGWPPKRRREQAARIRKQKPWRFSTGPRTANGKIISCRNAYKHGYRRFMWRELRRVLAKHRRFLRDIKRNNLILPRYPKGWEEFRQRHTPARRHSIPAIHNSGNKTSGQGDSTSIGFKI